MRVAFVCCFILHPSSFILSIRRRWSDSNAHGIFSRHLSRVLPCQLGDISKGKEKAEGTDAEKGETRRRGETFLRKTSPCHPVPVSPCRHLHPSSFQMAEGYGVEPYTAVSRRSFQDCLTHSTVGPSGKTGRDARI